MSTQTTSDQPKASPDWSYSKAWRVFVVAILRVLLRLLMRYEWSGRENFPKTGGVILAPNHLSYADWPAVALFSDAYGHRFPVFMIKSAIFEVKVLGPLMFKLGELPVYRGRGDAGLVLRQAEQALRAGACVIVYPEGTCTRDPDLWPMTGQTGAARLALATGTPVLPVASWGAHELLPYPKGEKGGLADTLKPGFHPFPRKTAQVISGPPVDLSRYQGQPLDAPTLHAATADIMAAIAALVGELRRETPPAELYDHHKAIEQRRATSTGSP